MSLLLPPAFATTRAWGTRFDSLDTSPLSSPSQSNPDEISRSPHPDDGDANRSLDHMPHDASVFIGSLPTNVDDHKLTQALTEHLAEYSEIKNIKVVRDIKGGACAFVQCEDPAGASRLIHALNDTPRPFMGRNLRYEFARAFRALFISYRTPTQFMASTHKDAGERPSDMAGAEGSWVELQPADAMRIVRIPGSRRINILYSHEARKWDTTSSGTTKYEKSEEHDALSPPGLLLDPLFYDDATLRTMTAAFGPLENFEVHQQFQTDSGEIGRSSLPEPHNGPRSSNMDPRCWEVKWQHRDHCVAALTTLRRVPHLTVTWARQGVLPNGKYANHTPNTDHIHVGSSTSPRTTGRFVVQYTSHPPHTLELKRRDSIQPGIAWSDSDFPPLHTPHTERRSSIDNGVWAGRKANLWMQSTLDDNQMNPGSQFLASEIHPLDDAPVATPDLSASPTSPRTSRPVFPLTPASYTHDLLPFAAEDDNIHEVRITDPSSIFVGGLESSPKVWDEDRIRELFAKFGNVESVQLVRPAGNKAAFAFVRFEEAASAERAVHEEHNTIHSGRLMRVQLRDGSATYRGARWGRGRGRYASRGFNRQSYTHFVPFRPAMGLYVGDEAFGDQHRRDGIPATQYQEPDTVSPGGRPPEHVRLGSIDPVEAVTSSMTKPSSADDISDTAVSSPTPTPGEGAIAGFSASKGSDEPAFDATEQDIVASTSLSPETSMDDPSTSLEPHKSSAGFQSQGWPQQAASYPVAIPFGVGYGYPGVSPTSFVHPSAGPSSAWTNPMHVYRYPYTPWSVLPPFVDADHHVHQAPLHPAGFIQGGQGTLIPIYQPDHLGPYMPPSNSDTRTQSASAAPPWTYTAQAFPVPMPLMPYSHALPPPPMLPAAQQVQIHQAVHGPTSQSAWHPSPPMASNNPGGLAAQIPQGRPPPYYSVASNPVAAAQYHSYHNSVYPTTQEMTPRSTVYRSNSRHFNRYTQASVVREQNAPVHQSSQSGAEV